MQLFDTHCHINDEKFDSDRAEVLSRMREAGVEKAVVIGDAVSDGKDVISLTQDPSGILYGAYGLHPHEADSWTEETESRIRSVLSHPRMVALGEIGLDYHYDLSARETQKSVFARQLEIARDLDKPAVLHIREAHGDAYEIMNSLFRKGALPRGIMHCFGGSLESALEYVKMGYYISFSGSLTFKNAPNLVRAARELPMDRLLIETDCPYMSPVPMRGKRNEPAFVLYTCEKLAQIKALSADEVARICFENALKAFRL